MAKMKQLNQERLITFFPLSSCQSIDTNNQRTRDLLQFYKMHFNREFGIVTPNARSAISLALSSLRLERSDEICVVTTFDYPNVSSCVTSTIFNYCKPSRIISCATKAVIVIHEFGVPYKNMQLLADECHTLNIPLIEDCAHTIDSMFNGVKVGTFGDWIICSVPKIFPASSGGLLLGRPVSYLPTTHDLKQISTVIDETSIHLGNLSSMSQMRRIVYHRLTEYVTNMKLNPLFEVTSEITPCFFPVHVPDVQKLMEVATLANIECGLWHGTNIVVFPCHQYLSEYEISRIAQVIEQH